MTACMMLNIRLVEPKQMLQDMWGELNVWLDHVFYLEDHSIYTVHSSDKAVIVNYFICYLYIFNLIIYLFFQDK